MDRRTFLATTAAAVWTCRKGVADERAETELDGHRVVGLELRQVDLPWPRFVGKNARLDDHGRGPRETVCVLRTDRGAVGWGSLQGRAADATALTERLVGRAVSELIDPAAGVRDDRWRVVDIPLHDLAATVLGVPVWKMLGGAGPRALTAYSGMVYFDDLAPPEPPRGVAGVLDSCRRDYDHGYRQFKLKIGRGNRWMERKAGDARDVECVRAAAEAFPDCGILVDANDGHSVESIIRVLEGIAPVKPFWIEEPFRETLADWRTLAAWCRSHGLEKTYLADGEADPDGPVLEELCREGTLTMRLEDVAGGGFTWWRRTMPTFAAMNVAASPHTWGSGLKTVYAAHLGAGYGNMPTLEGVTCGDKDVDFGGNRLKDGLYHVSDAPGFGLTLR